MLHLWHKGQKFKPHTKKKRPQLKDQLMAGLHESVLDKAVRQNTGETCRESGAAGMRSHLRGTDVPQLTTKRAEWRALCSDNVDIAGGHVFFFFQESN